MPQKQWDWSRISRMKVNKPLEWRPAISRVTVTTHNIEDLMETAASCRC